MNAVTFNVVANATTISDARKQARELGRAEGEGANSRPDLFKRVITWGQEGVIDADAKAPDVENVWADFLEGRGKKVTLGVGKNDNSLAAQVSKLRVAAKFSQHPKLDEDQQNEVIETVERVVKSGEVNVSMFDAFVKVCRDQNKSDEQFDEAQVKRSLGPKSKDDPSEVDVLSRQVKALGKAREEFPSEALDRAIADLEARIADLQGASKVAELAALVAAAGFTLTPALASPAE
jgi:hypothetical protein